MGSCAATTRILCFVSHRVISIVLLLATAVAIAVFAHRPPRAQAHLAALDEAVSKALEGQTARRIYFANTNSEVYVWCRYFAAPRLLVNSEAHAGDTMLWVQLGDRNVALDTSYGTPLADHSVGAKRAILYVAR